jgi:hypothetical protein
MATQNGLPSTNPSAPPFATAEGLPAVKDGGGGKAAMPQDRPQSMARPEVVPSDGEIPKGGKELYADPSGQAGNSGTVTGVAAPLPFKNLR